MDYWTSNFKYYQRLIFVNKIIEFKKLTALNGPVSKYIKTYSNNVITTKFMSAAGNLLCGVPTTQLTTTYLSDSVFQY